MKQIAWNLILLIMILTSCQEKLSMENDLKALEQLNTTWNNNILTGHRTANADLFTEDGLRIEGGENLFRQRRDQGFIQQSNSTKEICASRK